jgi:Domain of unknown function (DUF4271)
MEGTPVVSHATDFFYGSFLLSMALLAMVLWGGPGGMRERLSWIFPLRRVLIAGKLEMSGLQASLYGFLFLWWSSFAILAAFQGEPGAISGLGFVASFMGLTLFLVVQEVLLALAGAVYDMNKTMAEAVALKRGLLAASGPWMAIMGFLMLYLQPVASLWLVLAWIALLSAYVVATSAVIRLYAFKFLGRENAFFFYLCSLEILPLLLLGVWVGRNF